MQYTVLPPFTTRFAAYPEAIWAPPLEAQIF